MTTTLTDRYIAATVRRMPARQRPEIERELRAAIADDIDARVAGGQAAADAEYAAVWELGDPEQLAGRYAQTPQALISHRVYSEWAKLTRLTCVTVLPIVFIVLVVVYAVHQSNVWITIFRPIGITLTVATYLLVCITALFVAVDRHRTEQGAGPLTAMWTPDQLSAEDGR